MSYLNHLTLISINILRQLYTGYLIMTLIVEGMLNTSSV
jgi:hypothetical protein